jgi:hypothetical protein
VAPSINAEAEVGELQLAHTGSKGVKYAFVVANAPSTYVHDIVVNIVNNTMCMCKYNFVHEVHGWNYVCILTIVMEHVSFFRSFTMSVLNSVINVDCVA